MKDRTLETTRHNSKYLAAAAVIAVAVMLMLTGGAATAQSLPELNFERINYSATEPAADGARTDFEVGVLLSAASQTAVTVDFHTEAVTATAGQDYIDVATTLRFPPGVTRAAVNIPILGDDLGEYIERFKSHLSNPAGAQLGSNSLGQVNISDDDANDTFRAWLEPHNNYVLESDGTAEVKVRLAGQYEHDITMILQTLAGGRATVGEDYEYYSRPFKLAPYETEKTIHINILDDRKKEPPELFHVNLLRNEAPVHLINIGIDDDAYSYIWIGDDDHRKAIQSTTSDTEMDLRKRHFQVAEGATDSYHVWLTRRPTEPVTIRLNPYDGDPDITIESATSHTFNADNWFEPYVVTINAGQDEDSVDGYVYIQQEVETEDPFFQNHTPGYVVANEMDNDPGDEPTVIESETHSGVNNGITASVAYAPYRHKGSPFLIRFEFTDPVPGGYMKMRDEVLSVTNGEVNRAYRTKPGGRHWTFDIGVYDSESPVTITLEGNRACSDEGAVCGRGGRKLVNTLTLTMQGKEW